MSPQLGSCGQKTPQASLAMEVVGSQLGLEAVTSPQAQKKVTQIKGSLSLLKLTVLLSIRSPWCYTQFLLYSTPHDAAVMPFAAVIQWQRL